MCWNPITEEILANILWALILKSSFAFRMMFDANSAILDSIPYIAFQYSLIYKDGQEFRKINISAPNFILLLDIYLFFSSVLLSPIIFDKFSKLFTIFCRGIKAFSHARSVCFIRYSVLRCLT